MLRLWVLLTLVASLAGAVTLDKAELQKAFDDAVKGFGGRVGVCAMDPAGQAVCVNGDQRFSLQSVMKLIAGMAVMDAVDRSGWKLDEPILVRKQDLSLYVQPIAKLVTDAGYKTTTRDLVRRAIVDSDSGAVDILIRKLGGASAVQAYLDRAGIMNVRVDRQERDLQTEICGLTWKPEYLDPDALERAIAAVPKSIRDAAYKKYQADIRDTATPRGMTSLLHGLAQRRILSAESSQEIFDIMTGTVTFPTRLKAGLPAGWTLGHKTGSSGSWNGITAATNDVGIIKAPDGTMLSITVFIGDSKASGEVKDQLMAKLAALTIKHRH